VLISLVDGNLGIDVLVVERAGSWTPPHSRDRPNLHPLAILCLVSSLPAILAAFAAEVLGHRLLPFVVPSIEKQFRTAHLMAAKKIHCWWVPEEIHVGTVIVLETVLSKAFVYSHLDVDYSQLAVSARKYRCEAILESL
jgi:hypothetical protein